MSGETEEAVSGWTVDTLAHHLRVIEGWRDRFDAERDRRYHEVNGERDKALDKAFNSASELSHAHNDLIRSMEKLVETFATRESVAATIDAVEKTSDRRFARLEAWQAKVTGGLLVVTAIGIANFVKLWTG